MRLVLLTLISFRKFRRIKFSDSPSYSLSVLISIKFCVKPAHGKLLAVTLENLTSGNDEVE